jgi:hypothetical protein
MQNWSFSKQKLWLFLKDDTQNSNVEAFIDHLKLLISQDDQSGTNFSVYQFFSIISNTQNEFCPLLANYLFQNLQNEDPIIEYFYGTCLSIGCGIQQNQV